MKICSKCKIEKKLEEFYKSKASKDGLTYKCKECNNKYASEWHHKNFEKSSNKSKRWRDSNPEKDKIRRKDWRKMNREKDNSTKRSWAKNNPEKAALCTRKGSLKYNYGITLDEYNLILLKQDNKCSICKQPETQIDKRYNRIRSLAVDHDHVSGDIRGLLCGNCNKGLGHFKDNIKYLKSAIEYLEKAVKI